jgi:hypothetical protein
LSRLYNFYQTEDGSYHFITRQGFEYLVYFSVSIFPDAEGNSHTIYSLGFTRNGKHSNQAFINKHDPSVKATIMFIVNDFFRRNDHRALVFFCFADDGYSRHRNIVFKRWGLDLDDSIEKHATKIQYEGTDIYASLMIVKDNPLKKLILEAFKTYLDDISNY